MRLVIAAVGQLKVGAERELVERYRDRLAPLGRSIGIGPLTIVEVAQSRRRERASRREQEAEALLAKTPDQAYLVALDEQGRTTSSDDFARHLAALRDDGVRDLVFIVGGPDGQGPAVASEARERLSLGALTLPHGLARIVLAEQLYRAVTILAGHPYHRD